MPYKSKAQQRKFHALLAEGKIDPATVKEFDDATDFKHLPEKAKHKEGSMEKEAFVSDIANGLGNIVNQPGIKAITDSAKDLYKGTQSGLSSDLSHLTNSWVNLSGKKHLAEQGVKFETPEKYNEFLNHPDQKSFFKDEDAYNQYKNHVQRKQDQATGINNLGSHVLSAALLGGGALLGGKLLHGVLSSDLTRSIAAPMVGSLATSVFGKEIGKAVKSGVKNFVKKTKRADLSEDCFVLMGMKQASDAPDGYISINEHPVFSNKEASIGMRLRDKVKVIEELNIPIEQKEEMLNDAVSGMIPNTRARDLFLGAVLSAVAGSVSGVGSDVLRGVAHVKSPNSTTIVVDAKKKNPVVRIEGGNPITPKVAAVLEVPTSSTEVKQVLNKMMNSNALSHAFGALSRGAKEYPALANTLFGAALGFYGPDIVRRGIRDMYGLTNTVQSLTNPYYSNPYYNNYGYGYGNGYY